MYLTYLWLAAESSEAPAKLSDTLSVMGQGMLGVFVVMILIYFVIVILNKVTKK